MAAACGAVILALVLNLRIVEIMIIIITSILVLMAEMVNTAIETVVNIVSPNYHPLAKVAKDVAAGAVLLTAFLAIIVACFIFGPRLMNLLCL